MPKPHKMTQGVQELIARLKDEGVKAGRDEADRMIADAQERAAHIIAKAKEDAEELMGRTRSELKAEEAAAKESLKTAIRDTELMLEAQLRAGFADHVKHLVSVELKDREFMKQLILAIAGRVCPELPKDVKADILIPEEIFEGSHTGAKLTKKGKEQMHHMVLGIAGDMLRDGVEIRKADDGEVGMRIKLVGQDMEIDLSDNAISQILLKYLLPRYRAIVAGTE